MEQIGDPRLRRLIERAETDPEVLAVILFGSRGRGEATSASDVDVCVVLRDGPAG